MEDQLSRLQEVQKEDLDKCHQNIDKWRKFREDFVSLHRLLKTLADRLDYDIMVPFGSVAFMPGKLVHTNEILVLLGENVFVERSSKQASEIVQRRIESCDTQLKKLKQEKSQLENWNSFAKTFRDESNLVNIVEEYDEDAEREWRERRKKNKKTRASDRSSELTFDQVMERLDELELEEESDRLLKLDTQTSNSISEVEAVVADKLEIIEEVSNGENKAKIKWKDEAPVTSAPIDTRSASQAEGIPNGFSFTSPADIYTHYQNIRQPKPLKSILKTTSKTASSVCSVEIPATKSVATKSQSKLVDSSHKVTFHTRESAKVSEVQSLPRVQTTAFSDVVIEREPNLKQNVSSADQPKRVSLFKASQRMKD